jgi:serine/threonine protein kinase/Flp pilus assembly protein TadD
VDLWLASPRGGIVAETPPESALPELQDHLTATLQDHYAIQREIGHGGMAVVYLARDLKHDRDVALKVLYPHLAEVLGRQRFLREIRVAAQLHHPHLLPLYDSGDADGSLYYVVPYIEGGSLRDRLARETRLYIQTAVQLAREVAEALDYAHRRKVVHRDIKPENVLLDEGHAVVADFGVARAISEAVETHLTQTGLLLGTPSYMSPEQAMGEPVDGRSDVYGLGCMLFELLTGAPPFVGAAPLVIMAQRLSQAAPRLCDRGLSVPPRLENAVARALARTPEERFRTAGELAEQLAAVAAEMAQPATTPTSLRSVPQLVSLAVLPFVNLGADAESEYFSDGMTEELISSLTKVKGLRVTARASAFVFKGKDVDVREIGQRLNVGAVLEGSVRRAGNRLRITAQLVNAADGYYVWSETFDRGMADIFAVQDELSRAITANLKVQLTAEDSPVDVPPTENVDAYTKYLQGLHHMNRYTVEGYREAIAFYQAAVEKDPLYAPPHAGIARCYAMLGFDWYAGMDAREAMPLAKASAARALQLEENLADGHLAMGFIRMLFDWDWVGAEASFRRALELRPGYAMAYHWLSLFLSTRNRHQESIKLIHRAQELDPLSLIINQNLGRAYHLAGHYDQAIEHFQRTLALEPRFFTTHVMLAESLAVLRRYDESLAVLHTAEEVAGPRPLIITELAFVLGRMGRGEDARRSLGELIERSSREHVPVYLLAVAHHSVGNEETGFDLLERACDERSTMVPWIGTHVFWAGAKNHPRLARILDKLNNLSTA